MANPVSAVRYMDTTTAYDLWSEVYDTDGNFLQALDTLEMKTLLSRLVSRLNAAKPWNLVDLGCGTGRNTMALMSLENVRVAALDLSPKMLEIASKRLTAELGKSNRLELDVFDMITFSTIPQIAIDAHAVISTLVVEHVPLDVFFATVTKMLRPDGLLLVTNMHPDMGKISQAGFIDPKTGEKIRPTSFAHEIDHVMKEAARHNLEIVGKMEERAVDRDMVSSLGKRAEKWIGVNVWFGGIFRKSL